MMDVVLVNGRVMTDAGVASDLAVRLSGDRIAAVGPAQTLSAGAEVRDLAGGLLLPGLIDIQVTGGGGALFTADPSPATVAAIGAAHRRFGTTGFRPTLISDDLLAVSAAIARTSSAIMTNRWSI